MKLSMQSIQSSTTKTVILNDTTNIYETAEQRRLLLQQIDNLQTKIALNRQERWNKIFKQFPSK